MSWYNIIIHDFGVHIKMCVTEIKKIPFIIMNYYQISSHGHLKVFNHLQAVIVVLWCFYKSEIHGKDPTKYFWPLTPLPNNKVVNLECIFHNWWRLHLTSGPVQMLEISKSNWLGRDVSDTKMDCFLPRSPSRMFLSFPTSLSDHLFPNFYTTKIYDSFLYLLFCPGMEG